MAAGVKLWLLTRDERLKAQILRRADRVHAVLSEHMTQRMGVMEYALRPGPGEVSLAQAAPLGDFGDVDVQIGERSAHGIGPSTVPLGPILEVRGPDPRALPVDHWRPWEEAHAPIGMAMVARVFGRPQDYWTSAVLALNVMQTGYREDGQIAFAMAWPTPAKQDLRPGVNVVWADGTDFRVWCMAALQWVEFLTKPVPPVIVRDALPLSAGVATGNVELAPPDPMTELWKANAPTPIHDRAQQLLAMTPAPTDPIQLAAYQRWGVAWEAVGV